MEERDGGLLLLAGGAEEARENAAISTNSQLYHAEWLEETNWVPGVDLPAGNYNWKVRSWNQSGTGPWSPDQTFDLSP